MTTTTTIDFDAILTRADLTAEQSADQPRCYRYFLRDANWPGEVTGYRTVRDAEKMIEYRAIPNRRTLSEDLTAEQKAAVVTRADLPADVLATQHHSANFFVEHRYHAGEYLGFRTRRSAESMIACWVDSPTTRLPADFFETLDKADVKIWS